MKIRSLFSFSLLSAPVLSALLFGGADAARAEEPYMITPELRAELEKPRYFEQNSPADRYERSRRRWKKAWIGSWVAFAAVNVIDAHSSTGHGEANPFLRGSDGRFSSGRAFAVKGGLGAGFFLWQQHMIRKNPERNYYKSFTFANTAVVGGMGAVAAHNYTLK